MNVWSEKIIVPIGWSGIKIIGLAICICLILGQCKKEKEESYSWPKGLHGRIIFSDYSNYYYGLIYTYDSIGLTQLTHFSYYYTPRWSPDGTEFLCVRDSSERTGGFGGYHDTTSELTIVNSDGTGAIVLPVYCYNACWSSDGSKILYTKSWIIGEEPELWLTDRSGEHNYRLEGLYGYDPDWSSDTNFIVVTWNDKIYLINLEQNSEIMLTLDGNDYSAEFSPDGTKIVYSHVNSSDPTSPANIFIMNSDGSDRTNLTNFTNSYGAIDPTWSPDGTMIAFGLYIAYDLYYVQVLHVMNADGTGLTRIGEKGLQQDFDWIIP